MHSPVKVRSPLFQVHLRFSGGSRIMLAADYSERALYVIRGRIEVDGEAVEAGRAIVLPAGRAVDCVATAPAEVMAFGGEPLGDRFLWWNFVASTRERIEAAKADWKAGRFALPPDDNESFIPLPEGR